MSRTANLKNRFYNTISKDRRCSNCKNLNQRETAWQIIFDDNGDFNREMGYQKYCTSKNSDVANQDDNCPNFKRKSGYSPFRESLINLSGWGKKQWKLHDKIIALTVTVVLTVITILVTYFLAKGIV